MERAKGCFGVVVRVLPATNHRGTRVKATSASGRSITVAWDYALGSGENLEAAARKLCGLLCLGGEKAAKGLCFRTLLPLKTPDSAVFTFPEAHIDVDVVFPAGADHAA